MFAVKKYYARGRETQNEIETIVARIKLIRKKYLCKLWKMYIHRNRCVFIFLIEIVDKGWRREFLCMKPILGHEKILYSLITFENPRWIKGKLCMQVRSCGGAWYYHDLDCRVISLGTKKSRINIDFNTFIGKNQVRDLKYLQIGKSFLSLN